MGYDIFESAPNLGAAYQQAQSAVVPLEPSVEPVQVAQTPSQLFNGGKIPASPHNAQMIGLNVIKS
ncbi:MAG: hypothetical protein ACK4VI_02280 [Alphaproteobacteria bacterium]